jgi:hypothetical protein
MARKRVQSIFGTLLFLGAIAKDHGSEGLEVEQSERVGLIAFQALD